MSISIVNSNISDIVNDNYYQFDFVKDFPSIQGVLKNKDSNSDFFEIENPIFVATSKKLEPLDKIIHVSKHQILCYYKIKKI